MTVCPSGGTPCDFSSISAAISAAVSDTVINVLAGSYAETSGPTTSLVPLTLSFQGVGSIVEGPHWDVWLRVNSTVNVMGNLRLVGAVEIGSQGKLKQQDRLTVVPPANFKCNATGWLAGRSFGVALSEGEWEQNGVVNVTLVSDYPAYGVISRPESESGGKWEQKADAYVRVESPSQTVGVSLGQNMEWIQTSDQAVVSAVSTTNAATAVYLEGDSEWKQTTKVTLSSTARSTLAATGVAVFGGNWRQSAQANLTITGPTGSAGVQTSLAAIGSSSGDAGRWVQEAPISVNWSGTVGHGFSCKEAGDWRCLTDDLTGLVGGVHIAEQEQGQCEWAMGYVPELPSGFSVQCESTYDSNAFQLPAALSPYLTASTGCAASTVVPTVALFDNSAMTAARGVVYEFIVTKDLLTSSVNFNFSVSYGNGSLDTASNSIGRDEVNTTISMRSNVNGSGSGSLQLLPALGSFALSKYRIALTFVTLYILNTPSADENIALVLSFNVSAPIIGVNPSRGSTDAPVGLNLVEIEEVAPNGTVVRTASALKGEWSIGQVPDYVGAAQTYRFSADLLGSSDTQFGLRWYLFDRATNVSVPSIVSDEPLAASPEFAKMTFQISPSWPWLSADNRLRLHMKVSPGFSSVTVLPDMPQRGVTSYELAIDSASGESAPRTAVVRLLGAALSKAEDGTLARVHVEHMAAAGEVVLSFDHFDGTLIFDPDFSVVVGSKKGKSSSDDGLVVAVAVAVPVAVVIVVAVILVALVAGVVSKRRYAKRSQSQLTAISIGLEDLEQL